MKEIQDPSLDSLNESGEEDGIEETQQEQQKQKRQERESILLQFLDSTDDYLNLLDALSSTLRQGWFDLASARHSMGTSRVSTALLDLKIHSAATSLRVEERDGNLNRLLFPDISIEVLNQLGNCINNKPSSDYRLAIVSLANDMSTEGGSIGTQPFINLRKWTSTEGGECLVEDKYNDKLERKSDNPQLRQRNISELSEDDLGRSSTKKEDALIIDDQASVGSIDLILSFYRLVVAFPSCFTVQKERSQTLSMFGTLVSPKLRSAQLSFENALEIIVEIANKRLAMSSSFDQVKKGLDDASSFEQVKEEL
ncbi:hypothetical protein SDJN02_01592 [Cucurbita argyrosperma subsp. argyrosperma]|nr:hypothetical protein SDJN02_01592 [Cucurbita argyrosperma subsp. argyrosperma]